MTKGTRASLREVLARNAASMRGYARAFGKPIPEGDSLYMDPPQPVARPRSTAPKPRTAPTEHEIQAAILDYLRRVVRAEAIRYNSGMMQIGEGAARRFVRFHDADGHADIGGVLPGGRAFYLEVKRPGEKPTPKQAKFLARMAKAGALTGVVTSVADVADLLGMPAF